MTKPKNKTISEPTNIRIDPPLSKEALDAMSPDEVNDLLVKIKENMKFLTDSSFTTPEKPKPEEGIFELGTWLVPEGNNNIISGDPCNFGGPAFTVKPGVWRAWTTIKDTSHGWGFRNHDLIVGLSGYNPHSLVFSSEEEGIIGVDSGQAGFYSAAGINYDPDSSEEPENYDEICATTLETKYQAGMVSFGVTSSTGFGDGGYPVYVARNENKEIIGLKVVYISDDEDC